MRKNSSLGIIGALDEEISAFLSSMKQERKINKAGMVFYSGKYNTKDVVVVKSGVGKVNAACCAQILLDVFGVRTIIFTGVAGAINPKLNIGDVVVSSELLQHDVDATALGCLPGQILFSDLRVFTAEKSLSKIAEKIPLCGHKIVLGRILTGDQFITKKEKLNELRNQFGGDCVEMEGAAVAQVCVLNKIPFLVVRSISDKADGNAHMDFREFAKIAADNSHKIVSRLIEEIYFFARMR